MSKIFLSSGVWSWSCKKPSRLPDIIEDVLDYAVSIWSFIPVCVVCLKERKVSANLRDVERLGKGKTRREKSVWRRYGILSMCWLQQVREVCVLGRLPSESKIIATVFSAVHKSSINFFQVEEAVLTLLQLFLTPLFLFLFARLCMFTPSLLCMPITHPVLVAVASIILPPLSDISGLSWSVLLLFLRLLSYQISRTPCSSHLLGSTHFDRMSVSCNCALTYLVGGESAQSHVSIALVSSTNPSIPYPLCDSLSLGSWDAYFPRTHFSYTLKIHSLLVTHSEFLPCTCQAPLPVLQIL